MATKRCTVNLPTPHFRQREFIYSPAKRKIIRAGRRGGKTVGVGIYAVQRFLAGHRILYGAPTADQVSRFWTTVTRALADPIAQGVFDKNETNRTIELAGTEQRIKCRTCWNADTLRGDYADELILDEYQLMDEDAWALVGAPMLLDNNGNCTFIYTPPSLYSRSVSKARDPRHASRLFKRAEADTTGRWQAFHFTSHDNPYISRQALANLTLDMTALAIQQEIYAEDTEQVPGALWTQLLIDETRDFQLPEMVRIVVSVDPEASSNEGSAETGIIVSGLGTNGHGYVLEDCSLTGTPAEWATAAIAAYHKWHANLIVGEVNNGGEMVGYTIASIDPYVPFKAVRASKNKAARAEPISTLYERGLIHHVGTFIYLEGQMTSWTPGRKSPDRLDSLVWGQTELFFEPEVGTGEVEAQEEEVSVGAFG